MSSNTNFPPRQPNLAAHYPTPHRDTSSSSPQHTASSSSSSPSQGASTVSAQFDWQRVEGPDGPIIRMVRGQPQAVQQHLGVIPAAGTTGAPVLRTPPQDEIKRPPESEVKRAPEADQPGRADAAAAQVPPVQIHIKPEDQAAFEAFSQDRQSELNHFLPGGKFAVDLTHDRARIGALLISLATVAPAQSARFPVVPAAGSTSWQHDLTSTLWTGLGLYMYAFGLGALSQRLATPAGPLAAHLAFGLSAAPSSATLGAAFVGATRGNYGGYTSPDAAGWTNCVTAYARWVEARTAGNEQETAQCRAHLDTLVTNLKKDIGTRNGQAAIEACEKRVEELRNLIRDLGNKSADDPANFQEPYVRAKADLAQAVQQREQLQAAPLLFEGLGAVPGAAMRSFLCDELPIAMAFGAFYMANGYLSVHLRAALDGPEGHNRAQFLAADLANNWTWGILSGMGTVALQAVMRNVVEHAPHPRGLQAEHVHEAMIARAQAELRCLRDNEVALSLLATQAWGQSNPDKDKLHSGAVTPAQVADAKAIHEQATESLATLHARIAALQTQVRNYSSRVRRDVHKGVDTLKGIVLGRPSAAVMKEFTGWPIQRRTIANAVGNLSYVAEFAPSVLELAALATLYLNRDHLPGAGADAPNPHFESSEAQQAYIDEGVGQMMPLAMCMGWIGLACWATRFWISPVLELSMAAVGGAGRRAANGVGELFEFIGEMRQRFGEGGGMPVGEGDVERPADPDGGDDNVAWHQNPIFSQRAIVPDPLPGATQVQSQQRPASMSMDELRTQAPKKPPPVIPPPKGNPPA